MNTYDGQGDDRQHESRKASDGEEWKSEAPTNVFEHRVYPSSSFATSINQLPRRPIKIAGTASSTRVRKNGQMMRLAADSGFILELA